MASLNVRDDSEIDWKLLPDSEWNLWSAHSLQRRWLTLKRSVRGYEHMTHAGTHRRPSSWESYPIAEYRSSVFVLVLCWRRDNGSPPREEVAPSAAAAGAPPENYESAGDTA